ncbi:MAG TPA: hypothetical protein VHN37_01285 [Actinomycetota bacterium]|nr:hypothetical protein [Actinomycetota bacterium]
MSRARRALVALTAMALSTTVLVAQPASAGTTCSGYWGLDPITIGAAGRPLATTPEAHVEVCVTIPNVDPGDPPGVEVKEENPHGYYGLFVTVPENASSGASVSVRYSVDGSGDTETVTVPIPGTDDDRICVFFWGPQFWYPGDCLVFLIN